MGWFSQKKEIELLRKQVAQLAQLVQQQHQPAGLDVGALLGGLVDGQVKQVESFGGFIRIVSDIAAERMGSALGRRGGKKRAANAQRDARGRMLPARRAGGSAGDCILCDDPTAANFTKEDFDRHQQHKNRPRQVEPEPIEPTREEREVIEHEHRHEPEPTQYPLPVVTYPLVPTPDRNEDSGAGRDSQSEDGAASGHRNGVA